MIGEMATPFEPSLLLGTIVEIYPDRAIANLPSASAPTDSRARIKAVVGDFVFIECETTAVLGRIVETKLPPNQRLDVEDRVGREMTSLDPLGAIQLLASWDVEGKRLIRGLAVHPRIGDRVFRAPAPYLERVGDSGTFDDPDAGEPFDLGCIAIPSAPPVKVTPKALVGRHCCILGATGGGKSWTVASIVEALVTSNCRVLLLDPTGEFEALPGERARVGSSTSESALEGAIAPEFFGFSYRNLTESDLFVLLNPSPGAQQPKLREAMRSLRLGRALNADASYTATPKINLLANDCIKKEGSFKEGYGNAVKRFSKEVFSEFCNFNINSLSEQIGYECVWDDGRANAAIWGGKNDSTLGHCSNLLSRIDNIRNSPEMLFMFGDVRASITDRISSFIDGGQPLLSVRLDDLSFQHSVREICLNALGRFLLRLARGGAFKNRPFVVVIDEAHQFLNKSYGNDEVSSKLDQFGLIGKEGRKYGLHVVFATQRPRDIPDDVLSQIGTMIVHRLTNERDREVVEKACGQLDRSAAAFLPTLQQGEALLVGADFPLPVPVQIRRPSNPPKSSGSSFAKQAAPVPTQPEAQPVPQQPTRRRDRKPSAADPGAE